MKQLATLLITLLVSTSLFARDETRTFNLQDFDAIEASFCYKIEVKKGNRYEIEVTTHEDIINELEIGIKDGTLKLGIRRSFWNSIRRSWQSEYDIKAVVTIPSELREVELSGASSITSADTFSPKNFKMELSGAASARLQIMTHTENIEVSGASNMTLTGLATNVSLEVSGASTVNFEQDVDVIEAEVSGASTLNMDGTATSGDLEISGASRVRGEDFAFETLDLDCGGASNATVKVSDSIGVSAGGASSVTIKGNPSFHYTHTSGASRITTD